MLLVSVWTIIITEEKTLTTSLCVAGVKVTHAGDLHTLFYYKQVHSEKRTDYDAL